MSTTLSGAGMVPLIVVVELVIGLVLTNGVSVATRPPTQIQTGSDSHCPGSVCVIRYAPSGIHGAPPAVQLVV